jgi:ABC-type transport system involved in multi-copper enzyme maturation permease subunit
MNLLKAQLIRIFSTKSFIATMMILVAAPILLLKNPARFIKVNEQVLTLTNEYIFEQNLALGNIYYLVNIVTFILSILLIDIIASDYQSGMIKTFITNKISHAKIFFGYLQLSLLFVLISIFITAGIFIFFNKVNILTSNITQTLYYSCIFSVYWILTFSICIVFALLIKSLFTTLIALWIGYNFFAEAMIKFIILRIAPDSNLADYIFFNLLRKFSIPNLISPQEVNINIEHWIAALGYFLILITLGNTILKKSNCISKN